MDARTRARSFRATGLALLLVLPGCAWLTPAAPTSGIAAPDRFLNASGPLPAWPAPEWWRGFNAPELDTLMHLAVTRGFDVAAAEARVLQADAQLRIAGAALLPAVSLSAQRQRQQSGSVSIGTVGLRSRIATTDSLDLGATYELDFWGRNRAVREAARLNAIAVRHDLGTVQITTEASLANLYFEFVGAQEQAAIARANLDASERILSVARARIAAGTATGLELAQQETVVAQQRAQLPPLLQIAEQSRVSLATLAGVVPEAVAASGNVFGTLTVPPVAPGLPAELLARRPDVLSAEQTLAAANANVVVARAALLPSVTLSASGGFAAAAAATLISPQHQVFSLVAGLVQPVFQGGALVGQVQLNEGRAGELLADYQRAIVQALVDAESGLIGLQQTTEQVRLQQEAVTTAERAFAIAEAQLRAGTIDLVSLLISQQSLFTARNQLVLARLARLQAAVALFRALGGGWSPTA